MVGPVQEFRKVSVLSSTKADYSPSPPQQSVFLQRQCSPCPPHKSSCDIAVLSVERQNRPSCREVKILDDPPAAFIKLTKIGDGVLDIANCGRINDIAPTHL